ncbi:MAG: CsgG/HfaB family protein [Verrucomicrobiota bacterium]|nr:CsgG/HfaB family protein [Verrucomicrobiota bacterium]
MNTRKLALFAGLFAATLPLAAQNAPGLKTIGISDVKPTPALVTSVKKAGTENSLDRVTQALDSQLIDRVHNTRKFEVIARSDLASVLKENDFTGADFKVKGVNYILVTAVDDFQDYEESAFFASLNKTVKKRVIRFSAVGKVYDAESGKLLESTNFQINNRDIDEPLQNSTRSGELSDELLLDITRKMADKIANRVVDVIYPAKIVAKQDKQVTLNRGDGTGIAIGQVWEVFALGEEMIDPDTGQSLGRDEVSVGKVKVVRVLPKTASAEILEDLGITKNAIVRPVQ